MKRIQMRTGGKCLLAVFLAAIFMFAGMKTVLKAQETSKDKSKPKVIMVILDRVTYPQLKAKDLPNLGHIMSKGGTGLMTISAEGELLDRNVYASIGAGSSTSVKLEAVENYNSREFVDYTTAADIYRRNSGYQPASDEVLQTSLKALLENSKKNNQTEAIGALGEALHKAGKKTAVIGNSDISADNSPEGVNRLGPLIAMDSKGRVDFGDVSRSMLIKDNMAPFGIRTDYNFLWYKYQEYLPKADFMVVDTGDTFRVEAYSVNLTQQMQDVYREAALHAADVFLGKVIKQMGSEDLLMVVTPLTPDLNMQDGEKLTPLILYGKDIPQGSLLYTPTTRRAGLVTTYDVAATVLKNLQVPNLPSMIGIGITGEKGHSAGELDKFYNRAVSVFNQRTIVLGVFVLIQVFTLLLIILPLIREETHPRPGYQIALYSLGLGGVALLITPLYGNLSLLGSLAAWVLTTVILSVAVLTIKDFLLRLIILSGFTSAVIIIDVLAGSPLMRWSFLGYDLIIGGRFYGIGNEFMGILIGASIMMTTALIDRYPQKRFLIPLTGLYYALLIYFFASPMLGTNAGGALAAVVGYAVTIYKLSGLHFNWRKLGLVSITAVIAGVLILILVNKFLAGGQQSHIGRAVSNLLSGNFSVILQTIIRKSAANLYLLIYSAWNKLIITMVAVFGFTYIKGWDKIALASRRYPALSHGLTGIYAGALAALAFNDSGVISLATMGVFAVIILYSLSYFEFDYRMQGGQGWKSQTTQSR